MAAMMRKPEGPLRRGWTTGACAMAAAQAAYQALLTGVFPDPVKIRLPRGQQPQFALARASLGDGVAMAAIVKDAGGDPDVTHGALIEVTLRPSAPGTGITFHAGPGVGTVTKPGLPVPPGEPAINPAPREMIREALTAVAAGQGLAADVAVTVSIPGGAQIALKTWNPRLGIVGGLSILGTTGIVIPYSCSAWIHSIRQGIDVARATGVGHLAAATGKTSEAAVRRFHGLDEDAILDMGDFVGGLLKYLDAHPVARLTIAGGFAKLTKLAQGHLDLHSSRGQVDFPALAEMAAGLGATALCQQTIRDANSAMEALDAASGLPLGQAVAQAARTTALRALSGGIT
ncbi:MAG: Cobalt-precorrin-5B C(1)-methyltransferase, partial [Alphaproteobacteria bacterium MarineAlpha10_Bin3]